MNLPVIVLGAGGHARVLLDALKQAGTGVVGATDSNPDLHGRKLLGVNVIGYDDRVSGYSPNSVLLVNGLGTTCGEEDRKALFERFTGAGYRFATVVHPSAIVGAEVALEEGAQVMAGAVIQTGSRIGRNAIINTRASIDHDCQVEAHVHIAPGATLSGSVVVGECAHVGTGACVIHGIRLGRRCLVAAGAVVIRDVSDGNRVAGVPAREFDE